MTLLLIATTSCESWIAVEPTDRLSEDKVFSTQKGFLQALNGVYSEMNNNSVYGDVMELFNYRGNAYISIFTYNFYSST